MAMLAEHYDFVIGGDPDRDTVDLAVVDAATGASALTWPTAPTAPAMRGCSPGRGSMLRAGGSGRWKAPAASPPAWSRSSPSRRRRRRDRPASSGPRGQERPDRRCPRSPYALAREQQANPAPAVCGRRCGWFSTTRQGVLVSRTKAINELKSLIVVAPEHLRAGLRGRSLAKQLDRIEQLASPAGAPSSTA